MNVDNNSLPPSRHLAADPAVLDQLLSQEEANRIIDYVLSNSEGGTTDVMIGSIWQRTVGWARNHVTVSSDREKRLVTILRHRSGQGWGSAMANQFDEPTLLNMIKTAELRGSLGLNTELKPQRGIPFPIDPPELPFIKGPLWSDATASTSSEDRARLATMLAREADAKGLLSAGSVEVRLCAFAQADRVYGMSFSKYTNTASSVTVRSAQGNGSGWAGESGFDWGRVDMTAIAKRALDKCIAAIDPMRVEPGRYTVVLESQAVEGLLRVLVNQLSRSTAESGKGPFAAYEDPRTNLWMTKLGTKIVDERVSLYHDPADTGTAVLPHRGLASIRWIDHGVLTALHDDGGGMTGDLGGVLRVKAALAQRNDDIANLVRYSFQMTGGPTSVDEMIRTTERGLLVTRFYGINEIDRTSVLATGVTRDGLWLIEKGVVTKAVKNMRFLESPLFVLNRVDQLGEPKQVFVPTLSGGGNLLGMLEFMIGPINAIVPPLKAHDFNFAALVDAV